MSDTLVFVHNPKAAGTTFFRLLEELYPQETIVRRNGPDLEAIAQGLPPGVRVVHGHLPFGLHAHLSGCTRYITVLREPVARAVSAYHYIRDGYPDHPLHDQVVAEDIGFEEFVRSGMSPILTDNGQVRLISGVRTPHGTCTRDMLELAKRNLDEHFVAVGVTERFDDFLVVCRRVLDWPKPPYYRVRNIGVPYPRPHELPGQAVELIREHNELDTELHRYAVESLDRRIDELGLRRELSAFRRGLRLRSLLEDSTTLRRVRRALASRRDR